VGGSGDHSRVLGSTGGRHLLTLAATPRSRPLDNNVHNGPATTMSGQRKWPGGSGIPAAAAPAAAAAVVAAKQLVERGVFSTG